MESTGFDFIFKTINFLNCEKEEQSVSFWIIKCKSGYVKISTKILDIITQNINLDDDDIFEGFSVSTLENVDNIPLEACDHEFMEMSSFIFFIDKYKNDILDYVNIRKYFIKLGNLDSENSETKLQSEILKINKLLKTNNFKFKELMLSIYNLFEESKRAPWISSLIVDLLHMEYSQVYKIYEQYGDKLRDINLILPIFNLFKLMDSKVSITLEMILSNINISTITKIKQPEINPVHQLGIKQVQKYVKPKTAPSKEEFINKQITFYSNTITQEKLWNNIRFVIRPTDRSFHIDNCGPKFNQFFRDIDTRSKFLQELTARELYSVSNVFASLKH